MNHGPALAISFSAAVVLAACASRNTSLPPGSAPPPQAGRPGQIGPTGGVRQPAALEPARPVAPSAQPAPTPVPPSEGPSAAIDTDSWRPQWWVAGVSNTDGRISSAAMATESDLLAARRAAVAAATAALSADLGREPTDTTLKVDTLRLDAGNFRAFVLVSAPITPPSN